MPIHFETDAERQALTAAWGDVATVTSGAMIRGQYDEPQADDIFLEGQAPSFRASLKEFDTAGATIGTQLSVTTFDGRARGPFTITRWQVIEDGAFVEVALQKVST